MSQHPNDGVRWIIEMQRRWAVAVGLKVDDAGYCSSPEENIPWLTPAIRADIAGGDGDEFAERNGRAKICALHASAALAANVLGYWVGRETSALASVLRMPSGIGEIRLERKYPTGLGGLPPNLDFTITGLDHSVVAVESKFAESYRPQRGALQDSYFPAGKMLWAQAGLPGAQAAAEAFGDGEPFSALDVPQLLKHMLGLAKSELKSWRLMLLWYDVPVAASGQLRSEIERFQSLLGVDAHRFEARTYQDLWSILVGQLAPEHSLYRYYVGPRYFLDSRL